MSNINLLQRLMKENRPPFLPFSQSCFNYFKVRGFIGFSELCIRTFHPDSQRYICPYLSDAHILEFRLPAATIECVINKQGICIEAINVYRLVSGFGLIFLFHFLIIKPKFE